MAKVLQHRRGTTAEHSNFTGAAGEITYDTTEKRVVAHDGKTKGGVPMAKKSEAEEAIASTGHLKSDILEAVDEVSGRGQLDQVTLEGLQRAIAALESRMAEQVGTVVAFASNSVPNGYLLCDGSAVSRTAYAQLFAVIGTTYGGGDGANTFNLPNLIDRFIHGHTTSGTVLEAGLPDHQHRIQIDSNRGWNGLAMPGGTDLTYVETNFVYHTTWASESSPIYGRSHTVQPPALTMRFCIKY